MRWVWITTLGLVAAVLIAFTIQNSTFEAPLQLDLWLVAWRLEQPASVPVLMWVSFGFGAVLPALVLLSRNARLAARVRHLEHEIAMGTGRPKDPWAGA